MTKHRRQSPIEQEPTSANRSLSIPRRISNRFGAIPSLIWAWVYLLLIPVFAILYTLLPSESFYHSTIRYDASYRKDQEQFVRDVERWAREMVNSRLAEAIEAAKGKTPTTLNYYAGYEPDDFWPQLLVVARFEDSTSIQLPFRLGGMTHMTLVRDALRPELGIWGERSEGFDLMADCQQQDTVTCEAKHVEKALKPDRYFIGYPAILNPTYRLRTQAAGFNSGADAHMLGRMLYLSAVTITTVGYGDIVPLTNMARIAVACEAILGVVLIGLFLNALAHEMSNARS